MGCRHGEAYGEKGISRNHWPARLEYYGFSVCSFMDQSFFTHRCSFFGGVGGRRGESIHLFFLFPGILQKERKVETMGLKGKMHKAK